MEKMADVCKRMQDKEMYLSDYATKSKDAIRIKPESDDIRTPFFRDIDRIIYSLSYCRYSDKTQVFSFEDDDHLSRRMIHVQLVSKIARTIGRALGLNEDLIEASALGHDIGHTPLGHPGEAVLDRISRRELGEIFSHNVQSVRTYLEIEKKGKGLNLSLQTLDGILCHNGEILEPIYCPVNKTVDSFLEEYHKCYTDSSVLKSLRPMTLEGCVVRISDVIGYIGRDIEDAIKIHKIKRSDIPLNIRSVLGTTNREIVNTVILDVIENSYGKPYIAMSPEVFQAIFDLKEFNYKYIYSTANSKEALDYYEKGINFLFDKYLTDIENGDRNSDIFEVFLNDMDVIYFENNSSKRMVLDYLAGMTDQYLTRMIEKHMKIGIY